MKEKKYYLYKIVNKINGKIYIGITTNPKVRMRQHFFYRKRKQAVQVIGKAIDKYGHENFTFDVICIGSKDYILDLEVKAIALYRTTEKKFGYNIKPGGESGRGYTTTTTGRDTPVFVSGWWFPARRFALAALNLTKGAYKNRQRSGTLGDIVRGGKDRKRKRREGTPVYVGGFWFPSVDIAALSLCQRKSQIQKRVRTGAVEQAKRSNPHNKGKKSAVPPDQHPSAKPVRIHGVLYGTIKQASEATGYSKYVITKRIKENHNDFRDG